MVEATVGITLLLAVMLFGLQLVLVMHASLAAQVAANRAARVFTITGGESNHNGDGAESVQKIVQEQKASAMGLLQWKLPVDCGWEGDETNRLAGRCTVEITVPVIVPGGALLGGHGLRGPLAVSGEGRYPYGEKSGL